MGAGVNRIVKREWFKTFKSFNRCAPFKTLKKSNRQQSENNSFKTFNRSAPFKSLANEERFQPFQSFHRFASFKQF